MKYGLSAKKTICKKGLEGIHVWDIVEAVFENFWTDDLDPRLSNKARALYIVEVCKNCVMVRVREAGETFFEPKES